MAVGRRNWTFAGSDAGGHRAAAVYTLIETCKMNDVDPQAWLADVLARFQITPLTNSLMHRGIGDRHVSRAPWQLERLNARRLLKNSA